MSKPSVGQLIDTLRNDRPPAGFVAIPLQQLNLTVPGGEARIEYAAFFNATTNQLILSGAPKPQPWGGNGMGGEPITEDAGIFHDARVVTTGSSAGRFVEKPIPVAQTEAVLTQLTWQGGPYPGASVSLVGEGSVGLAFSVTSYNLRSGDGNTGSIDGTVTLNSWLGRWTHDGAPDAGVLDIRTRDMGLGDPAYGIGVTTSGVIDSGWTPGAAALRVDVDLAGVDRAVASMLSDVAAQEAIDAGVDFATGKLPDPVGNAASWATQQLVELVSDEIKPFVVDWISHWVGEQVESSGAINAQVGWLSELSAADAATVVGANIGRPQWNAMHGLSATGLEPGVTRYDTTGPATIVGAGESAEMRQPVTQITTYRDPQTNAVVEGRVQGQLQNGVFVATPGSTGVFGVAADGRVIVGDGARQTVIAPGQTAASGEITPSSPSLAEALSNSGEQAVVVRPPSSALVNQEDTHTVTLNPGGTLSDIVLLQGRAGNPVTVADLLAANPQYTDVTKIPAGAELNVPVRTGDVLSIYRGSGAVETINTRTAEITSTTQDAQGNTHQVISRPDGDDGRIYIERTLHAGTGEVVSSSAVRVDTMSGQIQPACRGRNRLREKTRSCLCRRGTTHLRPQNEYQRTNGLSDLTGGSPMGYYRW